MSRIGRLAVPIPEGVEVKLGPCRVDVTGPKGSHSVSVHPEMQIEMGEDGVRVKRPSDSPTHRSLHGLTRTLIANCIEGVTKGFERVLEINGVGYRAAVEGDALALHVGFGRALRYEYPSEVEVKVDGNRVIVSGIDKKTVGEVAAKIRSFRPPEPYNGKGIKYLEEVIRRKAGKATA
jgi:large subunit ribosomal protein L6